MNTYSAILIMMLVGSSFDLQSYTNYEMKTYKRSQTARISPPVEEPKRDQFFDEWNSIIQKHTRDKIYKRFHKKK